MKRARQLEFFTPKSARHLQEHAKGVEHGGEVRKNKRKLARPFDHRRPLHLTLKSSRARGDWSMKRLVNEQAIGMLIKKLAKKNGVRIYQYANSGNHLHLLLRAKTHEGFKRFLRTLSAMVARIVTGARKGHALAGGKFWDTLAWSRIVNWGRQFFYNRYYVIQNELEAEGIVSYKTRVHRPP